MPSCFYRPQRSCDKVMFSDVSVILSADAPRTDTPWTDTPWTDTPWTDTPWADTPVQTPPGQTLPQQTAKAADGTHPTGMPSCSFFLSVVLQGYYSNTVLTWTGSRCWSHDHVGHDHAPGPNAKGIIISSAIHKAADSLVTGCSLQNGKNCHWQKWPSDTIPLFMFRGFLGIVPVKSYNGRELWGRRFCEYRC